jgi:hypothetical protein
VTVPERLDGPCQHCDHFRESHNFDENALRGLALGHCVADGCDCPVYAPPERLDPALHGNDDSPDLPDQSMQWGVRWENGVVSVERDQEAASLAVDVWTARGVQAALVCRVCGPWQ